MGVHAAEPRAARLGLDVVDVDAGQMSQVFNNLTLNAVQAMPEGGTITYTVGNVTLAPGEVPTLEPGDYLRIAVRDLIQQLDDPASEVREAAVQVLAWVPAGPAPAARFLTARNRRSGR